jgi:hypothetical protein
MHWAMMYDFILPRLCARLSLIGRVHGIYRAKSIVVAVRSFARFLGDA